MKSHYKYFVACHPRSGSRYVTRFLWDRSIRVGHEFHEADGLVSWAHVGVGRVPWLKDHIVPADSYGKVAHLVRHPIDVIASCAYTELPVALEFIQDNLTGLPPIDTSINSRIRFFMATWVRWNELIEELNYGLPPVRFKIETLREDWGDWLRFFGPPLIHDLRPPFRPRIPDHTRKHPRIPLERFAEVDSELAEQVKIKGKDYGYEWA